MEILKLIAAFFTAALSGMGVGGGGLLLIFLTLCLDIDQHEAQLTNLLFFLAASSASLLIHFLKRKIDMTEVMIIALFGAVGSVLGAAAAGMMQGETLRIILGGFLAVSGVVSLFAKSR